MQLITYKTNIPGEAALHKLMPVLNTVVGATNWQFDSQSSEKKLTVFANDILDEDRLVAAIQKVGFLIENLDDYYAIY